VIQQGPPEKVPQPTVERIRRRGTGVVPAARWPGTVDTATKGTIMADRPSPIELQKHLGGMDYPAGKDEIVEHAKSSGASKEVIETLQKIPDREYNGPNAVSAAFSDKG
jgi:hypothetical protein